MLTTPPPSIIVKLLQFLYYTPAYSVSTHINSLRQLELMTKAIKLLICFTIYPKDLAPTLQDLSFFITTLTNYHILAKVISHPQPIQILAIILSNSPSIPTMSAFSRFYPELNSKTKSLLLTNIISSY